MKNVCTANRWSRHSTKKINKKKKNRFDYSTGMQYLGIVGMYIVQGGAEKMHEFVICMK